MRAEPELAREALRSFNTPICIYVGQTNTYEELLKAGINQGKQHNMIITKGANIEILNKHN
jgi:hypothetical protein